MQIKLNSSNHITLHKVEEKMVPISLLRKAFDYGYWMSAFSAYNDSASKNKGYNNWLEQNVK